MRLTSHLVGYILYALRVINMNIVVLDGYSANPGDLSWDELKAMGEVTVYDRTSPSETVARAAEAEVVLTNKVVIGREEMAQLQHLKYIGVLATGYNVVDIEAAHERGITVTNVPAYSTESVAQMVFAHLLTVTNRTEHYAIANREGRWSSSQDFCYWDFSHMELSGKTFGIIGPSYVEKKSKDEIFSACDVVSLHCPLTPDTHHLIDSQVLRKMKPSTILINTGRGPLVDDQAVAEALAKGQLAAFCADVLTEEPPKATNPLLRQPNAFITPHIAWASKEARSRLLRVAIDNVRSFLTAHPQNVV